MALGMTYVQAIEAAGGIPVVVPVEDARVRTHPVAVAPGSSEMLMQRTASGLYKWPGRAATHGRMFRERNEHLT
jgi:hypothetical protein